MVMLSEAFIDLSESRGSGGILACYTKSKSMKLSSPESIKTHTRGDLSDHWMDADKKHMEES